MANASVSSTYAGKLALPYVAPAILSADSIANGYISTRQNVRYKAILRKVSGVALQARDCTFGTPDAGQLTLSDVVLTTTQLKVNEQICNYELREAWEAEFMRGANSAAPAELTNYVAQWMAARVAESVEYNMWQGNYNIDSGTSTGAAYSDFDGIMNKIVAGTPGYEVNLGGALTAANILAKLQLVATNSPTAITGDYEKTKIFMSRASYALYFNALAATYNLPFLADDTPKRYLGYEVIVPAGFPDDTIVMSQVENLFFGTDLLTDMTSATFLNMLGQTGEDSTRGIMQFSAGCQVVDVASLGVARRTT